MTEPKIVTTEKSNVEVYLAGPRPEVWIGLRLAAYGDIKHYFFDEANATLLHEALGRALAK